MRRSRVYCVRRSGSENLVRQTPSTALKLLAVANLIGAKPSKRAMGNCLDCFRETGEARDPIMDAQARQRAADAAQARQDNWSSSAAGKRGAKERAKLAAAEKGGISASAHQQRINDIIS